MTKVKHHGVINIDSIKASFLSSGYMIEDWNETNHYFKVRVSKDFSKSFNIEFDGLIKLEVTIWKKMHELFCYYTYPKFVELTNIIPKKAYCHVYPDGSFCYAPPQKPLDEGWVLDDFIKSVDALINNYFCIEYIGQGILIELEHGTVGLRQYNFLSRTKK